MFSAYNGVRWGTGLPRQFQYERTQSRIGGTPWNSTKLFMENSLLFYIEKVQTPVNNDEKIDCTSGPVCHMAMPALADYKISQRTSIGGDKGVPVVVSFPDSPQSKAIDHVAEEVARQISIEAMKPELTILTRANS